MNKLTTKQLKAFRKDLKAFYAEQKSFTAKMKRRRVVSLYAGSLDNKELMKEARSHNMNKGEFVSYLNSVKTLYN